MTHVQLPPELVIEALALLRAQVDAELSDLSNPVTGNRPKRRRAPRKQIARRPPAAAAPVAVAPPRPSPEPAQPHTPTPRDLRRRAKLEAIAARERRLAIARKGATFEFEDGYYVCQIENCGTPFETIDAWEGHRDLRHIA